MSDSVYLWFWNLGLSVIMGIVGFWAKEKAAELGLKPLATILSFPRSMTQISKLLPANSRSTICSSRVCVMWLLKRKGGTVCAAPPPSRIVSA